MNPLAVWLETHKDELITSSVNTLSTHDNLRHEASGPVRWFFDSLIQVIISGKTEKLEALLRNWVNMCSIPINGQPVGLLPVLGVFKQAIWQHFQADPPSDNPLALAAQFDHIITQAAEYLAKVEASALFDAMSHHLTAPVPVKGESNRLEHVKNAFVSVTAHELKTPLTIIEGYTNMLKMELGDVARPREALMMRGIESGVTRLRELIEDMIDVSLIEIDLMGLEFQPIWLRRVLGIAETEIGKLLTERKLQFEIKYDTIPGKPIVGDPERLLKAFLKVLLNAIKYTPDGGQVTVYGCQLNGFVDLVIEDTGIGIAPEHLDLIFEKFSMLSDPTRHSSSKVNFKGGGPGLGLVIARGIVEAHGGTIWAESPGTDEEKLPGSRFHLMLPAKDVSSGEGMSTLVASAASMITSDLSTLRRSLASAAYQQNKSVIESQAIRKAPDPNVGQQLSESIESSDCTLTHSSVNDSPIESSGKKAASGSESGES